MTDFVVNNLECGTTHSWSADWSHPYDDGAFRFWQDSYTFSDTKETKIIYMDLVAPGTNEGTKYDVIAYHKDKNGNTVKDQVLVGTYESGYTDIYTCPDVDGYTKNESAQQFTVNYSNTSVICYYDAENNCKITVSTRGDYSVTVDLLQDGNRTMDAIVDKNTPGVFEDLTCGANYSFELSGLDDGISASISPASFSKLSGTNNSATVSFEQEATTGTLVIVAGRDSSVSDPTVELTHEVLVTCYSGGCSGFGAKYESYVELYENMYGTSYSFEATPGTYRVNVTPFTHGSDYSTTALCNGTTAAFYGNDGTVTVQAGKTATFTFYVTCPEL